MNNFRLKANSVLTTELIDKFIIEHETTIKQKMIMLQEYHKGKNSGIFGRKTMDANGPDNRTAIPYGRKLITTYTGYAFKPNYITYVKNIEGKEDEDGSEADTTIDNYVMAIKDVFHQNNEPLKTAKIGQSLGIFGYCYEILYLVLNEMGNSTQVRFFETTPIDTFMIWDYSAEPKKVASIRYVETGKDTSTVEVYDSAQVVVYERKVVNGKAQYFQISQTVHFFGSVPVIEYVQNDDRIGLIEPVKGLIDDYDILVSDSLNEYQKFANAYLRFVGTGLVDPQNKKDPSSYSKALNMLKRFRLFEHLKDKDDVTFLTKDIPKDFIEFMTKLVHDQIHVQSHVPDFNESKFGQGTSGETIKRMLFDFENVCSTADAYINEGLFERIRLINNYFKVAKVQVFDDVIQINHKRNLSDSLTESADVSLKLKQAGFSAETVVSIMPKEVVPDVEAELERQEKEMGLDIE